MPGIRGDLGAARATLESAVWSAIAGRNARAHASATTALVTITGHSLENVDAGARWGEHARAVLQAQGDPPTQLAALEGNLGNVAMTRRDRDAALVHFREAVRLYEAAFGPEHANVGRMLANVAVVLRQQGVLDLAEHTHARAIEILEASLGPGHPDLGPALSNWATVLHARGRFAEALVRYRAALAVGEASLDAKHPQLGHAHNNIGETMLDLGDPAGAEQHLRAAIAIWEQALGHRHSLLASPYGLLGRSLLAQARGDLAIVALEHALSFPTSAVPATVLAEHRFALAQALWSRPDERARARSLVQNARVALVDAKSTARVIAIDTWLSTDAAP